MSFNPVPEVYYYKKGGKLQKKFPKEKMKVDLAALNSYKCCNSNNNNNKCRLMAPRDNTMEEEAILVY